MQTQMKEDADGQTGETKHIFVCNFEKALTQLIVL